MVEKSAPFDILVKAIETVAAGRSFFGEAIAQAVQQSLQRHALPQERAHCRARARRVATSRGRSQQQEVARNWASASRRRRTTGTISW